MSLCRPVSFRLFCCFLVLLGGPFFTLRGAPFWVSAYYAGYHQGELPPTQIDFEALTHVIHFAVIPRPDGTLDQSTNVLPPQNCSNLVNQAHLAGKKALICIGGQDSADDFRRAITNASFIGNITNFVARYNYDGVDIDWEVFRASDANQFITFINELRLALNGLSTNKLLTVAAMAYPHFQDPLEAVFETLAAVQNNLDQINIMTYRLSGAHQDWVTWFTGPIFDGNFRFPNYPIRAVPSADAVVTNAIANGISRDKMAIGIYFSGDVWIGGPTVPRQTWHATNKPTVTNYSYRYIMDTYFRADRYHWDEIAQAPYLSIDNPGTNDMFISYEDERSCQAKVSYARNQRLGGVMIFELGNGYRPNQPINRRHTLLQAIGKSFNTPRLTGLELKGTDILLTLDTLPLSLNRIEWATNLTMPTWSTLTNNVPGSTGTVQILHSGALIDSPFRVYRVKTPP